MLFINTRPKARAEALTQCMQQAGYTVLTLPVLELEARSLDATLLAMYQQLPQAQMIVVVSPTAVEVGMDYLQQSGVLLSELKHIQWVAVGQTTAQALNRYGVECWVPEVETSEGMLSLTVFDHLQVHQKIAFWRGEGGRQLMMQHCHQQKFEVLNFILYERFCPASTFQRFESFLPQWETLPAPYWVCISSEASWQNWLTLLQGHLDVLQRCHYLVLGERLYQLLSDHQKRFNLDFKMTRVDQLKPQRILQTIEDLKRGL